MISVSHFFRRLLVWAVHESPQLKDVTLQSAAKTECLTGDYPFQQGTELVRVIIFLTVSNVLRKRPGNNRRAATEMFRDTHE